MEVVRRVAAVTPIEVEMVHRVAMVIPIKVDLPTITKVTLMDLEAVPIVLEMEPIAMERKDEESWMCLDQIRSNESEALSYGPLASQVNFICLEESLVEGFGVDDDSMATFVDGLNDFPPLFMGVPMNPVAEVSNDGPSRPKRNDMKKRLYKSESQSEKDSTQKR